MVSTPIPVENYIHNPGYLKLDLMLKGVRVDPSFFKQGLLREHYSLSPAVLGNIELMLPQDVAVSVPYQEKDVEDSPYKLRSIRGKHYLTTAKDSIPVKVIPHPCFYDQAINARVRIGEVLTCHGGQVALALGGRRFLQSDLESWHQADLALSVDEVIAILERVRKDGSLDSITLSSWSLDEADGGFVQLEPYIQAIKSFFKAQLFVELNLPQNPDWIDRARASGIDAVCYRLKGGNIDSELTNLGHAISVFPSGKLLTRLTLGPRPLENVLEDMESLTAAMILPVLIFASRETLIEQQWTTERLASLFGYLYKAATRHKIPMDELPGFASFMAPLEGYFFSENGAGLKKAIARILRSTKVKSSS